MSPSPSRLLYAYTTVLEGFAVRLTEQEATALEAFSGISAVYKDTISRNLHTTRSPGFLELNAVSRLWRDSNFGNNVIIGLVDTGIWPESLSFGDHGLGPVPSSWKGKCEFPMHLCNKKLIGAQAFLKGSIFFPSNDSGVLPGPGGDYNSPRDGLGHGTHTASIAAGAPVPNDSLFGFAKGIARGVAPKARIAMYKACYSDHCVESDVLAAIEKAILDGVHVLSISLSLGSDMHAISRGSFAAVERGIFVACSAGNQGPLLYVIQNTAPWITPVGASSIDRTFPALVLLGNGISCIATSLYKSRSKMTKTFPLLYIENCASIDSTDPSIKGKFVVCSDTAEHAYDNGFLVQEAQGVGLVQINLEPYGEGLNAAPFTIPALIVGFREGQRILNCIRTAKQSKATLKFYEATLLGRVRAPVVASTSSRGPNFLFPEIIKPDIISPGFNILGAFSPVAAPTGSPYDPRRTMFNIMSGTSMACPHVAGAAALLRAQHPNWSPAAIKSALMTTARHLDNRLEPILRYEDMEHATPFDMGAGHINPELAEDPGLIYNLSLTDYVKFVCSLNLTAAELKSILKPGLCRVVHVGQPRELNYPSLAVVFKGGTRVRVLKRTVTNVATQSLPETYRFKIFNPSASMVKITVQPKVLTFSRLNEEQSFAVSFTHKFRNHNHSSNLLDHLVAGSIVLQSDRHVVRSPIAVMWE